ncbi:hypothetical protein SprV_0301247400 [Sparganum proliferum]
MGDFNAPNIGWNLTSASGSEFNFDRLLLKSVQRLHLIQHVLSSTRLREGQLANCLDLVLTKAPESAGVVDCLPPLGKSDHVAIQWEYSLFPVPDQSIVIGRNIWRGDFGQMRLDMRRRDWKAAFTGFTTRFLVANHFQDSEFAVSMADAQNVEEINYVHQQTIQAETVAKELRYQKLFTKFGINPFKKICVLTGKPNVSSEVGQIDEHFLKVINRAALEPKKVHEEPQTVNQEYGWIPVPLMQSDPRDRRFNFGKKSCEMTLFMGSFWKQKEASSMGAKEPTA